MRRGTRVGQAYVALTVDGSGVNEDIVHSVDKAGPGIEKAGDEQGKNYGDHFSEGFFSRVRERFRNRGEDGALGFGKDTGKSDGAKIGGNFTKSLLSKIDNLGPETSARLRGMMAEVEKASKAADRALSRVENDNGKSPARLASLTAAAQTAENAATRMENAWRAALRAEGLVSRNSKSKNNGLTGLDELLSGTHFRNNALNALAKGLGGVVHVFDKLFSSIGKSKLVTKVFDDIGGGVSKLFSVIGDSGPVVKLSEGLASIGEKVPLLGKLGSVLGSGGEALGGVFSKIAATGPGALVIIAGITLGATILISVINALVAAVVALAATIASALTAAVAVGAAGLAGLAVAAGLTVLAFRSMTDAQKKALTETFKPVHEELIGIGQDIFTKLSPAFSDWAHNIERAVVLLKPLADVLGGALARAGSTFTASLSGPGFHLFLAALATTLPTTIANLSHALGEFLNGTLGIFAALMPLVVQFSQFLNVVATRFAAWATSAQGQNAIVEFVARAVDSLHSLFSFVTAVGILIATVLFNPSGQKAGNNLFDSMTAAVRRFTAFISKDDRLKKWFAEGVVFAQALGSSIVTIGQSLENLNKSGVIDGLARIVDIGAGAFHWFSKLPSVVQDLISPIQAVANIIDAIGKIVGHGSQGGVVGTQAQINSFNANLLGPLGTAGSQPKPGTTTKPSATSAQIQAQINSLTSSGLNALNNTSISAGGFKPKATKPKWQNPWVAFANSLINNGPSIAAQVKNAILTVNKQVAAAIADAARSTSVESLQNSLSDLVSTINTSADQTVNTAQSALNSAAQSLASATTKNAAKRALANVRQSQKDLKAALADQKRIQAAAAIINAQQVVTGANVDALLKGFSVANATLADFAEARSKVTDLLTAANQKLSDAIALRDQFKTAVSDAIKSFAALTTAQAQTIDGVQQALTSNDITGNLQTKLDQIKTFQNNLRLLLAQGLSQDAYKQIVDAGVEVGGSFATALVAGGTGSIQQVNSLVSQINGIADTLGTEASNRMYQAGVDAAQGLVDGLNSLSAQLDAAATALGVAIANSLKTALGIASPSRVLIEMMDHVGDGAVVGLDNQHSKVGMAARRFSDQIAISPEVAAHAAQQSQQGQQQPTGVSGNQPDPRFRDLIVQTPTEDPLSVAREVLNEVVGRL